MAPRAVILGCRGARLSEGERRFFAAADPLGFILFARNCREPAQVRALVDELREAVGRVDAPVLIDQEGGRVARLKPPHWRAAPAPRRLGRLGESDPEAGCEAARLNARLLAAELAGLGITVDCMPVLDLGRPETHAVIGDRAFTADPELAAALGRAVCEGMLAGGVQPMVKHLPGHGRARADSHRELPVVEAAVEELRDSDWRPFRALADAPWGMTAHVLYPALDPERPASISPRVVSEVIRGAIGFAGVLVSDDLSMRALSGDLGTRAATALAAGCDAVLHCNGRLREMQAVAEAAGRLAPAAERRLAAAAAAPASPPEAIDGEAARRRLDALLEAA